MAKILSDNLESPDSALRVVELSSAYSTYTARQLVAKLSHDGFVELVRLDQDDSPASFRFDSAEAAALIEAYSVYQADLAAAREQETARMAAMRAQAFAIAEEIPAIEISGKEHSWRVSIARPVDWQDIYCKTSPDVLLQTVKRAHTILMERLRDWHTDRDLYAGMPEIEKFLDRYGYLLDESPEGQGDDDPTVDLDDHPF